jgi:hypothetical protein
MNLTSVMRSLCSRGRSQIDPPVPTPWIAASIESQRCIRRSKTFDTHNIQCRSRLPKCKGGQLPSMHLRLVIYGLISSASKDEGGNTLSQDLCRQVGQLSEQFPSDPVFRGAFYLALSRITIACPVAKTWLMVVDWEALPSADIVDGGHRSHSWLDLMVELRLNAQIGSFLMGQSSD